MTESHLAGPALGSPNLYAVMYRVLILQHLSSYCCFETSQEVV